MGALAALREGAPAGAPSLLVRREPAVRGVVPAAAGPGIQEGQPLLQRLLALGEGEALPAGLTGELPSLPRKRPWGSRSTWGPRGARAGALDHEAFAQERIEPEALHRGRGAFFGAFGVMRECAAMVGEAVGAVFKGIGSVVQMVFLSLRILLQLLARI